MPGLHCAVRMQLCADARIQFVHRTSGPAKDSAQHHKPYIGVAVETPAAEEEHGLISLE